MKPATSVDAARVELLLADLRLPAIKTVWPTIAEQADKEGWPAARFLATLAEHEMVERGRRRFERHLEEARLPPGKTIHTFDFKAVPMVSKAQVMATLYLFKDSCGNLVVKTSIDNVKGMVDVGVAEFYLTYIRNGVGYTTDTDFVSIIEVIPQKP